MNDFGRLRKLDWAEYEPRIDGADWEVIVMTNGGLSEDDSSGGAGMTAGTVFGRIAGVSATRWACG